MTSLDLTRNEAQEELRSSPAFPVGAVVIAADPKRILSMIDDALSKLELAIHVMPAEPLEALQSEGEKIIFFPKVELRVRIIERPSINSVPMRARDARDAVMMVLQGFQPSTADQPLSLAPKPVIKAEFPGQVIYDVVFHFASHLYP
jgi:hypothetical protein